MWNTHDCPLTEIIITCRDQIYVLNRDSSRQWVNRELKHIKRTNKRQTHLPSSFEAAISIRDSPHGNRAARLCRVCIRMESYCCALQPFVLVICISNIMFKEFCLYMLCLFYAVNALVHRGKSEMSRLLYCISYYFSNDINI